MPNRNPTISYSHQTGGLFALVLVAAATYVYFLNASVVHVVLQKEVMVETQVLKNEIALLESEYIKAQHLITERMASLEGMDAERTKIFVRRDGGVDLAANQ